MENLQNIQNDIYKICKFEKYAILPNIKMFGQRCFSHKNYNTTKGSLKLSLLGIMFNILTLCE